MASTNRHPNIDLALACLAEQGEISVFHAVALVGSADPAASPIGTAAAVSREVVRLWASASTDYPLSDVWRSHRDDDGRVVFDLAAFGLSGPAGVLPHQVFNLSHAARREGQRALQDFFDVFTHRSGAFFVRAWAKYRLPAALPVTGVSDSPILGALAAIAGVYDASVSPIAARGERLGLSQHCTPAPIRLPPTSCLEGQAPEMPGVAADGPWRQEAAALSPLLQRRAGAAAVARLVRAFSGYSAKIVELVPGWSALDPQDQTRLGRSFSILGEDFVLGEEIETLTARFSVEIGPVPRAVFYRYVRDAELFRQLCSLIRLATGPTMTFSVRFLVHAEDVKPFRLGADETDIRLGWSTWLGDPPAGQVLADTEMFPADGF